MERPNVFIQSDPPSFSNPRWAPPCDGILTKRLHYYWLNGQRPTPTPGLRGSKVGVDDGNARFTGPRRCMAAKGKTGGDQQLRLGVG